MSCHRAEVRTPGASHEFSRRSRHGGSLPSTQQLAFFDVVPLTKVQRRRGGRRRRPWPGPGRSVAWCSDTCLGASQAPSPLSLVHEFHCAFGLTITTSPTAGVPGGLAQLRVELVAEELQELRIAIANKDIVDIADALGDIVYVTYGAALTFGVDLDLVLSEIHRSNMSKLGRDGLPLRREDGKVLKGPDYRPPDLLPVLTIGTP